MIGSRYGGNNRAEGCDWRVSGADSALACGEYGDKREVKRKSEKRMFMVSVTLASFD